MTLKYLLSLGQLFLLLALLQESLDVHAHLVDEVDDRILYKYGEHGHEAEDDEPVESRGVVDLGQCCATHEPQGRDGEHGSCRCNQATYLYIYWADTTYTRDLSTDRLFLYIYQGTKPDYH